MTDTNKSFDDYFNSNFEDGLSSPSKYILRFTYEAGQQSKQKEIDELNLTMKRLITSEEDIARGCKHWRDSHRELDERLDKVLDALCESGKTKEYRIEHAICLLKGEEFVW